MGNELLTANHRISSSRLLVVTRSRRDLSGQQSAFSLRHKIHSLHLISLFTHYPSLYCCCSLRLGVSARGTSFFSRPLATLTKRPQRSPRGRGTVQHQSCFWFVPHFTRFLRSYLPLFFAARQETHLLSPSLGYLTLSVRNPNSQCALYSPVPVPLKNFLPRSACQSVKSPSSLSRSMCILSMFNRAERLSK